MVNYEETGVKLTNTQLNKLKSAAKTTTTTTKIWNNINNKKKKNFPDEELSHELFLTVRQKTKTINAFAINISTDIKLSKAQISKIIQFCGSFGSCLGNLGKRVIFNYGVPFARDKFSQLVSNIASNAASNEMNLKEIEL